MDKLISDIEKAKRNLQEKAAQNGIYENFGQKEHQKLKDRYIDSSCYNNDMNKKRDIINDFFEWCINYTGA